MNWKKSLIVRIFLILLAFFVAVLALAGTGIYLRARQSVGMEFIRLNQATLNQVASSTGSVLAETINFCDRVSVNSRVLELMEQHNGETEKEIHNILASLQGEFNASHTSGRSMTEVYVLGTDGLRASSFHSDFFTWDSIASNPLCADLISGKTDTAILPVRYEESSKGIMRWSFQVVCIMRDLLDKDPLGAVVVDASELLLSKEYQAFGDGSAHLQIVSGDSIIQSDRDKRKIGTDCGWNIEELAGRRFEEGISKQIVDGKICLYAPIPASNWILMEELDADTMFGTLRGMRNTIFWLIGLCAVLAMAMIIFLSRKLLFRVTRIREGLEKISRDDLTVRLPVGAKDEFGSIETSFNVMASEMENMICTVRSTEREKRKAEMDFLNAQINTHFIHNTLTSIRFMLEMGQTQEAGEMLFYFSKLLRETLTRSSEFIPLRREIETLKSYVNLQQYRYQNTFEAEYDIDESVLDTQVPSLILQPVVENAIFHGVGRKFVHITISARRARDRLVILVEDDGVGMADEVCKSILKKDAVLNHVGLRNIHDRIQLCYGAEYGLNIESREGEGTRITYTLPMDNEKGSDRV